MLPNELARRGFKEVSPDDQGSDRDPLPGFYYRDDAYRVWNALHRYFTKAINLVYPEGDTQMLSDVQLLGWLREINDPDCAGVPGIHSLSFPFLSFGFYSTVVVSLIHPSIAMM
jgi:hypothetical protein